MGKRNKSQHLGFLLYNMLYNCQGVTVYTKFEDSGSNSRRETCGGFLWQKEKWTKKGNDKQEDARDADSILHNTASQNPIFVPTFKILGLIGPEKSDRNFPCLTWMMDGKRNGKRLSFLHNRVQPSVDSLDRVVPEKSLTEKKVHAQPEHTQTNIVMKKTKLYTPFILCMPGV